MHDAGWVAVRLGGPRMRVGRASERRSSVEQAFLGSRPVRPAGLGLCWVGFRLDFGAH